MTVRAPLGQPEKIPAPELVQTIGLPGFQSEMLRLTYARGFDRELFRHCKAQAVQIIHNHGLWTQPNHAAARVARRLGVPVIVSTHGMLAPWALRHKAWKKRLAWWAYQKADLEQARVIRVTAEHEALAVRRLGFRQPIAFVPNGIEMPGRAEPANGRHPRVLLFVGRICPVKGLLNLVGAWAALRPQGWRCVLAGPDEAGHKREIEAAISAAGLGDWFTFPGAIDGGAKWDLYRSADLFALPSFSENFGQVAAEALASGVPVITTRATPWEELETRRCGWWIETGVEPLVKALRSAMALSDAEREEMGRRGKCLVEARYTWPAIGRQMCEIYQWMVGAGPKPECVLES